MARRLLTQVYVDDKDGNPVLYRAGSKPPDAVAAQITNPAAWEPEPDTADPAVSSEPAPPKPPTRRQTRAQKAAEDKAAAEAAARVAADAARGSAPTAPADDAGTEAWAAYAETVGVPVTEGATVDQIKADLADRGLLEQ